MRCILHDKATYQITRIVELVGQIIVTRKFL